MSDREDLCRMLQVALQRTPTGPVTLRVSLADAEALVATAGVGAEDGPAELFLPRADAEALVAKLAQTPSEALRDEISPEGGQDSPSEAQAAERYAQALARSMQHSEDRIAGIMRAQASGRRWWQWWRR